MNRRRGNPRWPPPLAGSPRLCQTVICPSTGSPCGAANTARKSAGRDFDFRQEVLCRQRLWKFGFGKLGRVLYHDWGVRLQSTRQGREIMAELNENTAAGDFRGGRRI